MTCKCTTCGKKFGGVDGFDRHRVGEYGQGPVGQNERRCLSGQELFEKGFILTNGVWGRAYKGEAASEAEDIKGFDALPLTSDVFR